MNTARKSKKTNTTRKSRVAKSESLETQVRRWEHQVDAQETVAQLKRHIDTAQTSEIIFNISNHPTLRQDGPMRRMLVSVAKRKGKALKFVTEPTLDSRPKKPDHTQGKSIAIAVQHTPRADEKKEEASASALTLTSGSRKVAIIFALLVGILIVMSTFLFTPRATIFITPVTEPITTDLVFEVFANDIDSDRVVPARILIEEEAVSGTFSVSHEEEQGNPAEGIVSLVNRTSQEQRIRDESRLRAENGMIFLMQQWAIVPPNGSVRVPVRASKGGTEGNLQSGRLTFEALPGQENLLYAEVADPFTGGTTEKVLALAEEDIERAANMLIEQKSEEMQHRLLQQVSSRVLHEDEAFAITFVERETDQVVGDEVEDFHLSGIIRAVYFVVEEERIKQAIKDVLSDESGYPVSFVRELDPNDWSLVNVDLETQQGKLRVNIENSIYATPAKEEIMPKLVNRTVEGAEEFLLGIPGIQEVRIELSPFWINRIPRFSRNIDIELLFP